MADTTSQKATSARSTISTDATDAERKQTRTEIDAEWNARLREEAAERRKQSWMLYLGGQEPFETHTFAGYDPALNETHRSLKITQDFNPRAGNLMLLGPVGTGKTHLTVAIARRVLESGGKARVFEKIELWDFYKENGIQPLVDLDCLVIQDVERAPNTDRCNEFLAYLFDKRKAWRRYGTLLTTNKPIEDLHAILGSKTADRIDGMFQILVIPPETKSVRGLLKRTRKNEA